ncbi:hypothetical protein FRC09_005890 [Ceratobasidium sp. 395]|nr:hypothetical protein FRC09_005890 [Ceratobasidium sp. 395]
MLMRKGVQNTRVWPRGIDLDMFGPHRRCYTTRRAWGVESVLVPTCTVTPGDAKSLPTPPPSPAPSDEQEFLLWKDRCVILYVGRLSHEKNLCFLIETFAILLRLIELPSLPPLFVFVGDGPARHDLEDKCLQKKIPAIFMGHRSGEDLAKCYASADVFAFPSYTETFGQVVLEALASGLPVVGLDADGTRDLVQHERTGLLLQYGPNRLDAAEGGWQQQFDPRSPRRQVLAHQYAALLRRLVTNTTLRRVMAGRASTSAPVSKSWDDAMGCIVDCYEETRAVRSRQPSGDWFDKDIAWPSQSPTGTGQATSQVSWGAPAGVLYRNVSAYGSNVQRLELSSLSSDDFTVAGHQSFPFHQLRLKRVKDFCDPTVKMYSGYLDVDYGAKHLFFYFFESRNQPDTDPVLMWINGGPGCSSSLGLFMELGPCSIHGPPETGQNGTEWNPYSWNNKANLFFLDQVTVSACSTITIPLLKNRDSVGVGFSYADYGETVSTTEEAAKNVQAFVTIFFETFSRFKGREFHMSGESYGGRYLPVFASEIVDQNKRAEAGGFAPINLKSVLIGNGWTDFKTMIESYYEIQCKNLSVVPFQDISTCVKMKQALPRCMNMLTKECVGRTDAIGCAMAASFCESFLTVSYMETNRNPYDMSKPCTPEELSESLCYPFTKHINNFLDRPETRKALGVHPSIGNYTGCSTDVGIRFSESMDQFHSNQHYVAGLLERGIRVGNQKWTQDLEWTGRDAYTAEKDREWTVDGKTAGITRSAYGLTFATVKEAGHMVPYDKPKEALAMLTRWLEDKEL